VHVHTCKTSEGRMYEKKDSDFLTEEIREIAEGELDKDRRLNARAEVLTSMHHAFIFLSLLVYFPPFSSCLSPKS